MSDVGGIVYVISNRAIPGYIKIGRTKCLYSRLKKLQTAAPLPFHVELAVKVENCHTLENMLHWHYRGVMLYNSMSRSEWYDVKHLGSKRAFVKDIMQKIKFVYRHGDNGYVDVTKGNYL